MYSVHDLKRGKKECVVLPFFMVSSAPLGTSKITDYGHMMTRFPISLQPKTISQSQMENSVKCMKTSAFCRKKAQCKIRLGTLDEIWTDSTNKNTLKHLKICLADLPNRQIGTLKKKLLLGVRSQCRRWLISVPTQSKNRLFLQHYPKKSKVCNIVPVRLSSFYFGGND